MKFLLRGGLFVLAVCPAGATRVDAQALLRGISGYARSSVTNQVVSGTLVSLQSDAGEIIQQTTTEGNGRFQFVSLARAIYYVTASAPGYRTVTQRTDLVTISRASVFLSLVPDERSSAASGTGSAVNKNELAIPENAQREFEKGRKLLSNNKDAEKSIPHFRKALELYPSFAGAYLFLGMAQMGLGKLNDAEAALGKAIEIDAKFAAAHLALGACKNLEGKFAEAEKSLVRGLELDPETADGHFELGKAYWALGRWQDAEPHARKALEIRPQTPPAHLLLGNILLRKREAAAALGEFKEYLRLDPNGPFVAPTRELVAKIEQALGTPR